MQSGVDCWQVWFLCLDTTSEVRQRVSEAMENLRHCLSLDPAKIDLSIRPVPDQMAATVRETLLAKPNHDLRAQEFELCKRFRDAGLPRTALVVVCPGGHALATRAQLQLRRAVWGWRCGQLSLVYETPFDHYILWHETLHLLDAKDCYTVDGSTGAVTERGPTCDCEGCVMQYEPTEDSVSEWPFLCMGNVELIRRKFGGHDE